MTENDIDFLINYKTDALYTFPASSGVYATLVGDSEVVIGEVDVTSRFKIAISAFYVQDKANFGTFKITKLKLHRTRGWQHDGYVQVNHFQISQMKEIVSIISSLDLRDAKKTRISLENLNVGALGSLLTSNNGAALLRELAASPALHQDIYAVGAKRAALAEFESYLGGQLSESDWQKFFERNSWIFGHGLNYIFLNKVNSKLESQTTGSTFDRPGKRADGLLQTQAAVSQYVLVEIKKDNSELLQENPYRSGCWGVSNELSNAVTQIQKTVFEFSRDRFKDHLKDEHGNDTGMLAYAVEPRSFLVIGNLAQWPAPGFVDTGLN